LTQFFKQFVKETKITMRRISKKYIEKAERKKNIKKGNQEERKTIELPLSKDTCAALDCVLLLRAQTHNVCVSTVQYILPRCTSRSIFVKQKSI